MLAANQAYLPPQRVFESLGGLIDQEGVVIGAFDGGLRGDP
jgi:hypothetical protein